MNINEEFDSKADAIKEEAENVPGTVIFKKFRVKGKAALKDLMEPTDQSIAKEINKTQYVLNFEEPIFIDRIVLITENEERSINSKISIKTLEVFSEKSLNFKCHESSGDEHTYNIGKVCVKIIIEGTAAGFLINKAKITKINIIGYKPQDIEKIEAAAQFIQYESDELIKSCDLRISRTREKIEELNTTIEEKESEISILSETESEYNSKIEELKEECEHAEKSKETLRNQIKALSNSIKEREETIKRKDLQIIELDGNIEDRESKISVLSKESAKLQEEIKSLTEDKDIFAIELQDYIKQGRASKTQYIALALLPISVISAVTVSLLLNSATLLEDIQSTRPTSELLISRLPFALISFALVTASYKICSYFIKQLTHINNERLNMTKLQIIARDVTESSMEATETDPEVRQELRAKIKMAALKSYMRENLTEHFQEKVREEKPDKNTERLTTNKRRSEHIDDAVDDEEVELTR